MRGAGEDTAAQPHRHHGQRPQLTETASRCPVKMCRRLQVAASQIMISLFLSPVAWQTTGDARDLPLGDPRPAPCALGGPRNPF